MCGIRVGNKKTFYNIFKFKSENVVTNISNFQTIIICYKLKYKKKYSKIDFSLKFLRFIAHEHGYVKCFNCK